ncbi:acyltransferase family protein [Faecalibacter macacae]|uniref:Acyltransferase n=1 Tax=Faecalibacter macacae TaxID=1859289 RepID=A0A3L9MFI6_9FLAO|nr:acyltransferase [Faecalibacter macacae]RLZ11673.1 acyltransferase [Faecalibacter macacae]
MKKILPNLTPLRFFLALFVLLFHLPEFAENRGFPFYKGLPLFFKGTEAVYVFFTLSGFLIIRNLISEKKKTNTINLRKFYNNRVVRIFPLYYLVLIFGFIYYNFILQFFGFDYESSYNLINGFLLGVFFFPNVLATYQPGGILEVLWSIGIEEQFYLLIAPLFFMIKTKYIFRFLILFTGLYFLIFHLDVIDLLAKYKMYFYYFSAGGILAYCSLIKAPRIIYHLRYLSFLLFILIFFTNIFSDNLDSYLLHLLYTIVFSTTIYCLSKKPIKCLDNPIFNYLGNVSYGIYMYHAIVFQIVGFVFLKLTFLNEILFIFLFYFSVIGLTIIISILSYKYFESYFLRLKH